MEEINLYDLLRYYAKNWLNIVIALMVGAIVGLGYTFFIQKPLYKSDATLLVVGAQRASSNQDSVVLNNYVGLFTSRRVLDPVIADQKYNGSFEELARKAAATNKKGTDILEVSIATDNASKSHAMLESAIQSFRSQAKELYGNSTVTVKVVDGASTPVSPSNVKPLVQVGLAIVAAVVATVVGMFFVYDYRLSNSSSSKKKTEKTKAEKVTDKTVAEKRTAKPRPKPKKTAQRKPKPVAQTQ